MTPKQIKQFESENKGRFFTIRACGKEYCGKDLVPVSDNMCAFKDVNDGLRRKHFWNHEVSVG